MKTNLLERKEHPSVVQYFIQMQNMVARLAAHGMQCRLWTVGLVCSLATTTKVLGSFHDMPRAVEAGLCVIPVIMLYLMNAYYHGLEKQIFEWRSRFVQALETEEDDETFIRQVYHDPLDRGLRLPLLLKALLSPSILFFYLFFMAMIMGVILL